MLHRTNHNVKSLVQNQSTTPFQFRQQKKHLFNPEFAGIYGLHEAIIINYFDYCLSSNKTKGFNNIDGRAWKKISLQDLASKCAYLTLGQVRRALENLEEAGVLLSDNFNNTTFDRIKWYAFSDEQHFLTFPHLSDLTNGFVKDDKTLLVNTDINTKKAAATDIESREPAALDYAKLAAASLKNQYQQPAKASVPMKIHPCLEENHPRLVQIPIGDKQWVSNRFSEAVVSLAVMWLCHPTTQIKKEPGAALKWFCQLPENERPKTPVDPQKASDINKQMAEYSEKHHHSPHAKVTALSKYVTIETGTTHSIEIFYEDKNFADKFKKVLIDRGFKEIKKPTG